MNKPSERKTKTTITSELRARTPEKSTARWEMTDEEISGWRGTEAYQETSMNKPSEGSSSVKLNINASFLTETAG